MNWKQAFAVGVIPPGLLFAEREPVAYLYNGVRLPKLPEWDKSKYPYACIGSAYDGGQLVLNMSQSPCEYNGTAVIVNASRQFCMFNQGEWKSVVSGSGNMTLSGGAIWANHDILNRDGSVYLAATDPVPVYE